MDPGSCLGACTATPRFEVLRRSNDGDGPGVSALSRVEVRHPIVDGDPEQAERHQ
ncbi:hypothetical protein KR100_08625 [Synechococcus sp. KORDI-100]|uniref:hypothetical protein n=1 Tax=Synechococcus sp. KORDI-100 TaxID=1280380 RepID=UPI0004E03BB1|nr:hypothetical protein [Synechococcus sp. KORDI-100]AII43423.1 hypothetical protein KR100_08625 [Synechococcus sp. KORDI-100]